MAKKFTALSINALKSKPSRYEIGDVEPGLYIRVAPSGAKSFIVRYKFQGISKRLTLAATKDISLVEARELTRDALRKSRTGNDPLIEKQRLKAEKLKAATETRDEHTNLMATALESYIGLHVQNLSSSREVKRMLKHDVLPHWGNTDIRCITKADVLALLNSLKERGSGTMANRLLANIRAFFHWAIANDYAGLTSSPCDGVKPPVPEIKRSRVLNNAELRVLLLAIKKMPIYWQGFYKLLIFTGCRRNEVAQAQWSEFDFSKGDWFLSEDRTKNKRPHLLPLPEKSLSSLKSHYIENCPYVFSSNGKTPISGFSKAKNLLQQEMEAIAETNDLTAPQQWRIHDIRRTVATGMAGIGIAPHIVEAVLNHVSGAISGVAGVYNRHGYYNEKKQALAAWAQHIATIENGSTHGIVINFRH